jgi:hypothetical protein
MLQSSCQVPQAGLFREGSVKAFSASYRSAPGFARRYACSSYDLSRGPCRSGGRRTKAEGRRQDFLLRPLRKTEYDLANVAGQKAKARASRGALGEGWQEPARGECRMPLARAAKRLKRLKMAMGSYWKKIGMDLGLAPRPLGFGATSVWAWRHAGLGSARPCYDYNKMSANPNQSREDR